MKKIRMLPIFLLALVLLVGYQAPARAAASIVVAQDDAPRMMNPQGDDTDSGLQ